jgi:dTDP-L-rhamnose 4-epimerase
LGDIRNNFADLKRLKSYFDCSSFLPFDEGLRIFVDWVKNQKIEKDLYNFSVEELKNKGLIR